MMATQFWFTKSNAARALDFSKRTVERYIAAGAIPVRRCGRHTYVHADDLAAFSKTDHPSPDGGNSPVRVGVR